ncbi:Uncharacterised protein [Bordetella trematum]|uniref:Uncharacterized protein n=1 Tax=Bordetella trematum TaxID=123899 RepID=A0A157NNX4_9BORD|nr:hypothetical protein [Bordetella trematum]NNH20888.1 hypothetical protein [Bordetella trematum]SAI22918.1 Uncharacterised protein [Bordetella trematum]SAI70595.1 Uncharacterised protein [Bordetella trematum]SUV98739.1 Uncharacterised protein [Bordetella trematum]
MFRSAMGLLALGVPLAVGAAGNWYDGGTLHNATLKEWAGAVTQNIDGHDGGYGRCREARQASDGRSGEVGEGRVVR